MDDFRMALEVASKEEEGKNPMTTGDFDRQFVHSFHVSKCNVSFPRILLDKWILRPFAFNMH